MAEVKIVYWSGTGNTASMAEMVAKGVAEAGGTPVILPFEDITPEMLAGENVFALGCPSTGKKVLLFGSYGWGDGEWMRNWVDQMTGAGAEMIEPEGVICNEAPDSEAEAALTAAGKALAAAA